MGGHGHGNDHHEPYKVPDWRIYKVEDVPELMRTKRVLASLGLKDPWLRNEVWRFDTKMWGSYQQRFSATFYRGFYVGVAATAVTLAVTYAYDKLFPSEHHHGHGPEH